MEQLARKVTLDQLGQRELPEFQGSRGLQVQLEQQVSLDSQVAPEQRDPKVTSDQREQPVLLVT